MEHVKVTIPRGFLLQGKRINKVNLRDLVGYDEQFLQEIPDNELYLNTRVDDLLERITTFEGISKEDTRSILPQLSIGDRVFLLLCTRQLLFGDIIRSTITCPKCEQSMSLELSVKSLLQTKHPEPSEYYNLKIEGYDMQIRPLTGFDQGLQSLSLFSQSSFGYSIEEKSLEDFVRSCILYSDPPLPDLLPKSLIDEIGLKMEEIDPLSDITFTMPCPECDCAFIKSFPVEDYIFRELDMFRGIPSSSLVSDEGESRLDLEVHLLAFNYHWSEQDILSIPTKRRKRYARLVQLATNMVI